MGISDDIIKAISEALQAGVDKKTLTEVAKETADSVKKRTRLGKGVSKDGANLSKLKALSDGYKSKRKGLRKRGKLSSETAPAKSNLTKSGQMLDSIDSKVTKDGFEIFVKGNQDEKVKWANENRPFMYLASFELKLIIEGIINRIRRFK